MRSRVAPLWLLLEFATATCAPVQPTPPGDSTRVQVASGPAHRGPWRQNDSDFRWVDDPAVDLAPDGDAYVVWVDQSRKDVLFQRYAPDGQPRLAAPAEVSRSPEVFSWLPRVLVDSRDSRRVYVVWQEIVFSGGSHGGEIFFARSTDGRRFGAPVNLSSSSAGDGKGRLDAKAWDNGSLDFAEARVGEHVVAWTEYEGRLLMRRSSAAGETFSPPLHEPPVHIAGDGRAPARGPSVAVAPEGETHLAWAVGEDPDADIQFASAADGRSFGAPRGVCLGEGRADAPKIALDARGTVHLVYLDFAMSSTSVRYCRMKRGAGAFEPPRTLSQKARAHAPSLAVDARDRIYVLWAQSSDAGGALALTHSSDGGERFATPVAVASVSGAGMGSNGSQQGMFGSKLAVGDPGELAIVNSTFRPGHASQVWLLRARVSD